MVMVQEWNFTWPLLSPGANLGVTIKISLTITVNDVFLPSFNFRLLKIGGLTEILQ